MRVHPAVHDRPGWRDRLISGPRRGTPHFAAAPATDSVRDGGVDGIGRLAQQGSGRVAQIHARGAGVIVISRKRTGLQSHDSSIGCAIALGQSGLACVVLGDVAISRFAVLVRLHGEGTGTHKCYPITLRDHEDLNLMSHLNLTGQCVPRRRAAPALSGQGGGDVLPHKRRSERDEHQRSHQQWHRGA